MSSWLKPTPLEEMSALRRHLDTGAYLFVKRDDLTPFGGGKFRKAAFLIDKAKSSGADSILTEGSIESRHARAMAMAAKICGIRCVLVLSPERDSGATEATLLEEGEGAEIVMAGSEQERAAICQEVHRNLVESGEKVFWAPFSGSTAETALAYAQAFDEFVQQIEAAGRESCVVFVASATGGIQAGLEIGRVRGGARRVRIVGVSPGFPVADVLRQVVDLANSAAALSGSAERVQAEEVCVLGEYGGAGYLSRTPQAEAARKLAKEFAGLELDPVYTGKAFAALLDHARGGTLSEDDTLVFWNTAG